MGLDTVDDEIQPIEERPKTKIIKVVEEALTRAFADYPQSQALHETILDAESSSNVSFERSAMSRPGNNQVPDFLQTFGPLPPLPETSTSLDPSYFGMTQRSRDGIGRSESSFSHNRSTSSSGFWQGSEFAAVSSNTTTTSSREEVQIAETNRMNHLSRVYPASIRDLEMLSLPLGQSEQAQVHASGPSKENHDEHGAELHLPDLGAADERVQTSSQEYTSTEDMMWQQEQFAPQLGLGNFDSVDWEALLNPRMETNDAYF